MENLREQTSREIADDAREKAAMKAAKASRRAAELHDLEIQYSNEAQLLQTLKEQLEPDYALLKKLDTLFLLPCLNPLKIVQKDKLQQPKLICEYGLQTRRTFGNHAKWFRTVITSEAGSGHYLIDDQVWHAVQPSMTGGPAVREWRTDTYASAPNPRKLELDESVAFMRGRFTAVLKDHQAARASRLGNGVGLILIAGALWWWLSS